MTNQTPIETTSIADVAAPMALAALELGRHGMTQQAAAANLVVGQLMDVATKGDGQQVARVFVVAVCDVIVDVLATLVAESATTVGYPQEVADQLKAAWSGLMSL